MSKHILSSLAIILATFSTPHLVPVAHAQTSFGKDRITTPTNRDEWGTVVHNELMRNVRHAESSLALHARTGGVSSTIVFTIVRDGTVTGFEITESTGNAALDQALLRAMSRAKKVTPFTPDMTAEGITFTLTLGVDRR